jgi:hypothetical protein
MFHCVIGGKYHGLMFYRFTHFEEKIMQFGAKNCIPAKIQPLGRDVVRRALFN